VPGVSLISLLYSLLRWPLLFIFDAAGHREDFFPWVSQGLPRRPALLV